MRLGRLDCRVRGGFDRGDAKGARRDVAWVLYRLGGVLKALIVRRKIDLKIRSRWHSNDSQFMLIYHTVNSNLHLFSLPP